MDERYGRCEKCGQPGWLRYVAFVNSTGINGDNRVWRWGWACWPCLRYPASAA
jgi:hypothetical protein